MQGPDALSSMLSAMSTMSADMSRMSCALATATASLSKRFDHMDAMSSMDGMSSMGSMVMGSTPSATVSTPTSASAMMSATSSAVMSAMASMSPTASSSSGMDMDMSMGQCKTSMLWNWNTLDSCFLSSGWRITSSGKFAGTCIGVFLWVVFLVFLGNLRRRFDRYIALNARRRFLRAHGGTDVGSSEGSSLRSFAQEKAKTSLLEAVHERAAFGGSAARFARCDGVLQLGSVRPNALEQAVRALLYAFEYSITWLLGLILMSYNGYVIISAFIGAAIGFLVIEWGYVHTDFRESTPDAPTHC